MDNFRVLASDIDGTLIHRSGGDDDESRGLRLADRDSLIHPDTVAMLKSLCSHGVKVGVATSRRLASYRRFETFFWPDFAVIEDGAVLLDGDGQPEPAWEEFCVERSRPGGGATRNGLRDLLGETANSLADQGWKNGLWQVETDGFLASFKVTLLPELCPDSARNSAQQAGTIQSQVPDGLRASYNSKLGSFVVTRAAASKLSALQFWLDRVGLSCRDVAAMGDDLNDRELLDAVGHPMTLESALPGIRDLVRRRAGFVALGCGHEGTLEMLRHALALLG